MNSLESWLLYLESLHPVKIDLGLQRVAQVLDLLAIPRQWPIPVIMLAGTNGKGTTGAALESMAQAAGYRVGVYSSPHLLCYNERVRENGINLTDAALCQAFAAVEMARGTISLSYFEFGTLAALWHFWQHQPDLLVLEVGLGGRLDAVNLIDADVSVITNIDFDHQEYLGHTLDAIGYEKAGIMRPHRPVVVGMQHPPASVLARAQQLQAPLWLWQRDFNLLAQAQTTCYHSEQQHYNELQIPHIPQINAALAITALNQLRDRLHVSADAVQTGLARAKLWGRMTRYRDQGVTWLLDVAHNPQSVAYLAEQLALMPGRKIAICSMLADKDIAASLMPVKASFESWWLAGLNNPRGLSATEIGKRVPELPHQAAETVAQACHSARTAAGSGDVLVVFGSFYTLAEALSSGLIVGEAY